MAKASIKWAQHPNYNPRGFIDKLKELRGFTMDMDFAVLIGLDYCFVRQMACGSRPIGYSLLLRVVYEYTEFNLDQIFEMMGVGDASNYLSGED